MGSNNSTTSRPRPQENEQRNARNFTVAEVARALENQRILYESQIKDLVQNRVATNSSPAQVIQTPGSARQAVAPPRPPQPPSTKTDRTITKINTNNTETLCLERQRTPYSGTNVARENFKSAGSFDPLYPSLDNGNNVYESTASTSRFPDIDQIVRDGYVCVNNNQNTRYAPSAPLEEPVRSASPMGRLNSRTRARPEDKTIICPTCKNRFGTKIFNCSIGHASCADCKARSRACGKCSLQITERRNISMEEYVHGIAMPCPNADEGCLLHFNLGEMEQHLKECPFKEIQCLLPSNKCRWKGKLSILAQHFDNVHPTHREGNVDTEMYLNNILTENRTLQLIRLGSYNFVFHLIVSEGQRKVCFAVQLLGTKSSATKWYYEIHVYNKREPRRKYQYVDKCFCTTETIDDVVWDNACAVLPIQYAKSFFNEGALTYKLFIKKDDTQRDTSNWRGRGGRGRGGYRKL